MTRSLACALASLLALPLVAAAQGNPLARPPAWAGRFADAAVAVELRPTEGGFDGSITVKGTPYRAKGLLRTQGEATSLEGTFAAGGKDYAFTAAMEGADTLILASAGTTYRLARQADAEARVEVAPTPGGATPAGGGPDLSHVRVGQKYVYALQGGQMQLTWTVREVGPGLVRYDMQTFMDMGQGLQPVGEPSAREFRGDHVSAPGDEEDAEDVRVVPQGGTTRRERVTIAGVAFDCLVTEKEGTSTWTPMTGDAVTFPLIVRAKQGAETVMELIRIDQP